MMIFGVCFVLYVYIHYFDLQLNIRCYMFSINRVKQEGIRVSSYAALVTCSLMLSEH